MADLRYYHRTLLLAGAFAAWLFSLWGHGAAREILAAFLRAALRLPGK